MRFVQKNYVKRKYDLIIVLLSFLLKVTNSHTFFEEICSSFTIMAVVRTHFENNNEVGVFSKLTNAYCLIGIGRSANFFATFESELDEVIPVIYSTIGGKILEIIIAIFRQFHEIFDIFSRM